MLMKKNGRGSSVQVRFSLPPQVQGQSAYLVGDFNHWDASATPMQRDTDGTFFTTLKLDKGHTYQFRYLVNNNEWHNDWQADDYVPNPYSGDNSVVRT